MARRFHRLVAGISCVLLFKKVKGLHNLPEKGFILAANHTSYFDIWVMMVLLVATRYRYVRFIAKKELVEDAHIIWLQRLFGDKGNRPLYIDRSQKTEDILQPAIKALRQGAVVGIYPEGGRSRDGRIKQGRTGMIRLAMQAQVPIVPLGIKGSFELMPPGKGFPRLKKRIELDIGKPRYFETYYETKVTRETLRNLAVSVMQDIASLSCQRYAP